MLQAGVPRICVDPERQVAKGGSPEASAFHIGAGQGYLVWITTVSAIMSCQPRLRDSNATQIRPIYRQNAPT